MQSLRDYIDLIESRMADNAEPVIEATGNSLDELDSAALAKRITELTIRAEKLRAAFANGRNPRTGAQYNRVRRQLGDARTAEHLRRPTSEGAGGSPPKAKLTPFMQKHKKPDLLGPDEKADPVDAEKEIPAKK